MRNTNTEVANAKRMFISALLAMEDQVMKSVFRSHSFVRKARTDEREF